MTNQEITIHTDGSCLGNPGRGGWGAVVRRYEGGIEIKKRTVQGANRATTNNRMEMIAAINGLQQIRRNETDPVTIYSDSQLLIRGMTEWVQNWRDTDWRGSGKKPVKNKELWQILLTLTEGLDVRWQWVRGHNGDFRNEEVDKIATAAARQVV